MEIKKEGISVKKSIKILYLTYPVFLLILLMIANRIATIIQYEMIENYRNFILFSAFAFSMLIPYGFCLAMERSLSRSHSKKTCLVVLGSSIIINILYYILQYRVAFFMAQITQFINVSLFLSVGYFIFRFVEEVVEKNKQAEEWEPESQYVQRKKT